MIFVISSGDHIFYAGHGTFWSFFGIIFLNFHFSLLSFRFVISHDSNRVPRDLK